MFSCTFDVEIKVTKKRSIADVAMFIILIYIYKIKFLDQTLTLIFEVEYNFLIVRNFWIF